MIWSMLEVVGTAVAMGNASEEVKAVAHFVAPSNDEEGVARTLCELVLAEYPTGAGGTPARLKARDQASS
jgi:3-deoxy-D-manno-octulosonate 8-phosphate phosphatase KdsC-like HAD superfamily phosphatase